MYDAVASSRSAVWVEQLPIAAELSRPVLRTEEAAEWSAAPVSTRASSTFRPADRPNPSIDSRVCLPNSDPVSVTVSSVVKMFLQSLERFACNGPPAGNVGHVGLHCNREAGEQNRRERRAETAKAALFDAVSALGRARPVRPFLPSQASSSISALAPPPRGGRPPDPAPGGHIAAAQVEGPPDSLR
jgi:hypothetical protein